MNLAIVESPTKSKTISQFLGKDYKVESSFGHVRDLPKSKLGVDIENNFEPQYVIPRKIQKRVTALRKAAQGAKTIILATDEDREGEAIAWHLIQVLGLNSRSKKSSAEGGYSTVPSSHGESTRITLKNNSDHSDEFIDSDRIKRIVFHEITKSAIQEALKHPRGINFNLVDAQQARRVLDRLVGYKLSPFLWKKVVSGLSAGRVQSVALHLIVLREEEIQKFRPDEYWTITALLKAKAGEFEAVLSKIDGQAIPKLGIKTKTEADQIAAELQKSNFTVQKIERKEAKRNPFPPFTTSTLQQTASRHLGFSSKKTMVIAQQLYENGHITYMRTDSVNLSKEAMNGAKKWIKENLEKKYECEPKIYKTKSRLAQEAHEAIRPTNPNLAPKGLGKISAKLERDQQKLYNLIWRRFIASQLPSAVVDATKVEVEAKSKSNLKSHTLQTNGNILRFDGYLKIWPAKIEEKELPELKENENLELKKLNSDQHFTEPPPRYNEASIIKTLEENGIGRPSTYAPIISVIQNRNYVEKIQGRFHPTEIGTLVDKVIAENFPEIVNIGFTAKMEEELDEIAEGKKKWHEAIREFYEPFSKNLEEKYEAVSKNDLVADEKTDEKCEKCGKEMVIKLGRFGKFIACSGFPECKNTKNLKEAPKKIGMKCLKCGEGDIIERRVNKKGRARGKTFWGCSRYPDCDYASWKNPKEEGEKNK